MAFLLGSFTSGLFGGASDVMSLANNYEKYKQNKILTQQDQNMMKFGEEARKDWEKQQALPTPNIQAGPISSTSAGLIKNSSSGSRSSDTNPFDDPVLNAMPPVGNPGNFEAGGALSVPNMATGGKPSPLQTPQAGTGANTAIPAPAIGKVPGPRQAAPHYLPSAPAGAQQALPSNEAMLPPVPAGTQQALPSNEAMLPPVPRPGAAPSLGNSMNPMGALMAPYMAGYGRGI